MNLQRAIRHTVGGLYSWLVTLYFGAVLLDVVYSGLLNRSMGSDLQAVYGEVSDLLLLIGGFAVFAGLLAIGFSWNASTARNLFAVSLLVIVVPGLLALLLLFPLSRTSPDAAILAYAPLLRLTPIGLGSLIGLLGFRSLESPLDPPFHQGSRRGVSSGWAP